MDEPHCVVITTVNYPTTAVLDINRKSAEINAPFYVIGDTKSPQDFNLPGSRWYDIDAQRATGLAFAQLCPTKHYARKNIGYLLAMQAGAKVIVETDDDNIPRDRFWLPRSRMVKAQSVNKPGWCNVYRYFSDSLIWPRGLPLDRILHQGLDLASEGELHNCPIQQGLADENPDVDAIFRLLMPLPQNFNAGVRDVILGAGVWCPFNSQNTRFWREAFPLLYLPFHCSFRMTDIWRSFVAQRLAWECGWNILFHEATVWQERNEHDLMRDFADEVPGYLNNDRIRGTLETLTLEKGSGALGANLEKAYTALIDLDVVGSGEIELLTAWRKDLETVGLG